jgi:tetratricopeptide (TPR) repeat protein
MTYALACLRLDRGQEIGQLTQRVLDSNAGEMLRATAYATLIESLRSEGKYREGNKVGRRLLDEGGSNFSKSIAYYEMAYNLAEMDEDLDKALDFARRSLEHAPEELRQFPLAALGWVHYKRRELDEAIDFLSQSTELGPSTTVLTRLGMALLASGDEDQARGVLARARRLDDHGGAIEERMMEFMKDSARIIERVRGRA